MSILVNRGVRTGFAGGLCESGTREALLSPRWPPWAQFAAVFVLAVAAAIVWVRARAAKGTRIAEQGRWLR